MAFPTSSRIHFVVDRLWTTTEVAELTRAATRMGLETTSSPSLKEPAGWVMQANSVEIASGPADLERLVYLNALASGKSIDGMLADARRRLAQRIDVEAKLSIEDPWPARAEEQPKSS